MVTQQWTPTATIYHLLIYHKMTQVRDFWTLLFQQVYISVACFEGRIVQANIHTYVMWPDVSGNLSLSLNNPPPCPHFVHFRYTPSPLFVDVFYGWSLVFRCTVHPTRLPDSAWGYECRPKNICDFARLQAEYHWHSFISVTALKCLMALVFQSRLMLNARQLPL